MDSVAPAGIASGPEMVAWSRQVTPEPMVSGRTRRPVIVVVQPPTVSDMLAESLSPAESVARTVKWNVPASAGEPEIAPAGLSDNPGGSHLSEIDQVYGGVPPFPASFGPAY